MKFNWISKNMTVRRIFLLGLFIRLVVMPFFAHDDLFAVHRRVGNIVCGEQSVFDHSSFGVHAVESIASIVTLPIVSCDNLMEIQRSNVDVTNLNRMLFFFKLPYLLFEIGYWYLMWRLLKSEVGAMNKKIAIFLALNPVVIYSAYLFGRFEPYAMFFAALILSLFAKYKNSNTKALVSTTFIMSLIFTIRFSYVFILPALIIAFGGISPLGTLSLILTAAFFVFFKFLAIIAGPSVSLLPESNWISTGAHPNYVFQSVIGTGQNEMYLFFLLTAAVFIWWLEKRKSLQKRDKVTLFSLFSTLILSIFYITSSFHPQYLSWIMPFLLVLILKDKGIFLWKVFWLSLPFYFLYSFTWGNDVTFGLAFPISTAFRSLDPDWFFPLYDHAKWANIGKSVFSGFGLYTIYFLMKNYSNEK